jgi:hypothetical protein
VLRPYGWSGAFFLSEWGEKNVMSSQSLLNASKLEQVMDKAGRVVHKVGCAAGVKCLILSGGFRKARRSDDYSQ